MKPFRTFRLLLCAGLCWGCPAGPEEALQPPPEAAESGSTGRTATDLPTAVVESAPVTRDTRGACCLRDGCFEAITLEQCWSSGGEFLGAGSDCAAGCAGPPYGIISQLQGRDSDNDGRNDLDEILLGTDPEDPHDGPDIDGDGKHNGIDRDVDGDGIPNAFDSDIDDDGQDNGLDNDRDADGEANTEDDDDDGDGVKDANDDDDDADGDDDGGGDDDDDESPASQPAEEFDLLALARRWFDDEAQDASSDLPPEDLDRLATIDDLLEAAEAKPHAEFDPDQFARDFFEEAIDEDLPPAERDQQVTSSLDLFNRMLDEDGDGLLDVVDPDPDGNGDRDDDDDGRTDLEELRNGTDPRDPDSD